VTVAIHQVVPTLRGRDATGTHTLLLRSALRSAGYASEIFAADVSPMLAGEVRPLSELDSALSAGSSLVVYQLSSGSTVADQLLRRTDHLVVNYHNVTPAEHFWPWAPDWATSAELGRRQAMQLAERADHAIADSSFNAQELVDLGYRSVSVIPPLFALNGRRVPQEKSTQRESWGQGTRLLFVGSLLPHKRPHDLVKVLAFFRRAFDPQAELTVVGSQPIDSYTESMGAFVDSLGLSTSVHLLSGLDDGDLVAQFTNADAFVCLSAHEGFCVPIVEAQATGLPVVALGAGAVAETMGSAGMLMVDRSAARVASTLQRLRTDRMLRRRLGEAGSANVARFDPARLATRFVDQLARIAARCAP
jgi:L-malate glycosyltransferase